MSERDTTDKFHRTGTAFRFVHNTLEASAYFFEERVRAQNETGDVEGRFYNISAALIFTAFQTEAHVNFVGWKVLQDGWPERASLIEKINLLNRVLDTDLEWGSRPLQSIKALKRLRDTLAHGKPDVEEIDEIVSEEPDLFAALEQRWEVLVAEDFLARCREDSEKLWRTLVEAARISHWDTRTRAEETLVNIL